MKAEILIGIDPGKFTGMAIWNRKKKAFSSIRTTGIIDAMITIQGIMILHQVEIWFEDARLIGGHIKDSPGRSQGVGSVKRDCSIWEEFCDEHKIFYGKISPRATQKLDQAKFEKLTKWSGRTSQHARDAAMLVYGG